MKKINRSIISLLYMFTMLISMIGVQAFAEPSAFSRAQLPLDTDKGLNYFISNVNKYTESKLSQQGGTNITLLSTQKLKETDILYFNSDSYEKQPTKVKQKILDEFYYSLETSEMTTPDKNRISNWMESIDQSNTIVVKAFSTNTQPDLMAAQKFYLPFTSPLSTFLGIMTLLIAMLLTVSFVWDLAFINIPMFEAALWPAGGSMTHENKPLFVSQDVVRAYNSVQANGSILNEWFKYRMKTALLLGFCLVYLVSNQIWMIIAWIMDTLSRML